MSNETTETLVLAEQVIERMQLYGQVVIRGINAALAVRQAIKMVRETRKIFLTFSPDSDPQLRDYIAGATLGAVEWGLVGGGIGLLLHLLGAPREAIPIAAGLGAAGGALNGIRQVGQGWRLRALQLGDGSQVILIEQE